MKVVCIIQARIGSSRLPGKVMKVICGKSILEHDIDRLKRVKNIDKLVIATTTLGKDDIIVEEAKRLGVSYFRGSEEDVLSRYYYAAKENVADVVVRVTSDCPLIDSEVTEKTIDYFLNNIDKFDYVSNSLEMTFPRGLDTEVFKFSILEKAFKEANTVRDREHVTPYIWSNPNMFRLGCYKNSIDYSEFRWTLDTIEDFRFIEKVYEHLYKNNFYFGMNEIINLLKSYKELGDINKGVKQKTV